MGLKNQDYTQYKIYERAKSRTLVALNAYTYYRLFLIFNFMRQEKLNINVCMTIKMNRLVTKASLVAVK